jgi:hypothetical protein
MITASARSQTWKLKAGKVSFAGDTFPLLTTTTTTTSHNKKNPGSLSLRKRKDFARIVPFFPSSCPSFLHPEVQMTQSTATSCSKLHLLQPTLPGRRWEAVRRCLCTRGWAGSERTCCQPQDSILIFVWSISITTLKSCDTRGCVRWA